MGAVWKGQLTKLGAANSIHCVVDNQGLAAYIDGTSKPPALIQPAMEAMLIEQCYWLPRGISPHHEHSEFLEWRRRENQLTDALCHLAQH